MSLYFKIKIIKGWGCGLVVEYVINMCIVLGLIFSIFKEKYVNDFNLNYKML